MSVYYQDEWVTLYHGDCLDVLAAMPDNSVDSIITDPPYGLSNTTPAQVAETITQWVSGDREYLPTGRGLMGKAWDAFVPPVAIWDECLRVLKPGGHVVAFAGSRTHDLMALGVRLAGFEIRDSLAWLYGSGFPKSMDISKAIDRSNGENRNRQLEFTEWMRSTGITAREINEATDTHMGSHYLTDRSQPAIATADLFDKLRPLLPEVPERIERLVAERTGIEWTDYVKREVTGVHKQPSGANEWAANYGRSKRAGAKERRDIPATSEAAKWDGWGTALKPAIEPIILARKPFTGTVARNVLEHGTGAINVDACRVAGEVHPAGRWPANVLLDEHTADHLAGAARYFYVAKAPKSERPNVDGIQHPTVKPLALMRWLIRLITPPGGTVLDPFAGSGTTIEAAMIEGFHPVGIEKETDYLPLITARITRAKTSAQGVLNLGNLTQSMKAETND